MEDEGGRVYDVTQALPPIRLSYAEQKRHAGKWAAFRNGDLVAAHHSMKKLRQDKRVRQSDAIWVVLDPDVSYFFAAA